MLRKEFESDFETDYSDEEEVREVVIKTRELKRKPRRIAKPKTREHTNLLEKKRRDTRATSFENLKKLIPDIKSKATRMEILTATINHIKSLNSSLDEVNKELTEMKEQQKRLEKNLRAEGKAICQNKNAGTRNHISSDEIPEIPNDKPKTLHRLPCKKGISTTHVPVSTIRVNIPSTPFNSSAMFEIPMPPLVPSTKNSISTLKPVSPTTDVIYTPDSVLNIRAEGKTICQNKNAGTRNHISSDEIPEIPIDKPKTLHRLPCKKGISTTHIPVSTIRVNIPSTPFNSSAMFEVPMPPLVPSTTNSISTLKPVSPTTDIIYTPDSVSNSMFEFSETPSKTVTSNVNVAPVESNGNLFNQEPSEISIDALLQIDISEFEHLLNENY